jgi:2-succinyl-5-enolpyruvyl-6-hydroxy-3-cyclohexene-1-carboxylate synthase
MIAPTVAPGALDRFAGGLIDELVRSGIRDYCACPGSRSTPLALAIATHPGARLWMHLDERSAAFFGLGLAKLRQEPVALLSTSGTAAANFFPAVVEAHYARVPLVVLTADRPHELRDVGAPQTIDQSHLFGAHAKWFVDLPEPSDDPALARYVRVTAARSVATARSGPAGPVHLNCPFREPLIPTASLFADVLAGALPRPLVRVTAGRRSPDRATVDRLSRELLAARRGLIVCGPQEDPALADAVVGLAAILDYPILADPLSGVRCGEHEGSLVVDRYDAFLRDKAFTRRNAPEVVLRFGAIPTSKPVLQYLQDHSARQILVDGDGGWNEPTLSATDVIHVDGRELCLALTEAIRSWSPGRTGCEPPSAWTSAWLRANAATRDAMSTYLDDIDEIFEGKIFSELAAILPSGATVFAGNSMPVRDLDTFFPRQDRPIRFLANRGANGIDGVVSSAFGASAGTEGPVVLVIGDISFYHDLNGLLAAKKHRIPLTIILVNNDGGGIFSFLPQADHPEHFEELFGTPHGLDFRATVEMYGGAFHRVADWEAFRARTASAVRSENLTVIEVTTDRARNVVLHRQLWREVSQALAEVAVS